MISIDIAAFPDSVNALPDISSDLRTPDKLVDGVSDTVEGHHMWLAPVLPGVVNSVYVVFDQPQAVSEVRLWNYGKTSSRGVKELAVSEGKREEGEGEGGGGRGREGGGRREGEDREEDPSAYYSFTLSCWSMTCWCSLGLPLPHPPMPEGFSPHCTCP